jgi:hypothetical protein
MMYSIETSIDLAGCRVSIGPQPYAPRRTTAATSAAFGARLLSDYRVDDRPQVAYP